MKYGFHRFAGTACRMAKDRSIRVNPEGKSINDMRKHRDVRYRLKSNSRPNLRIVDREFSVCLDQVSDAWRDQATPDSCALPEVMNDRVPNIRTNDRMLHDDVPL